MTSVLFKVLATVSEVLESIVFRLKSKVEVLR